MTMDQMDLFRRTSMPTITVDPDDVSKLLDFYGDFERRKVTCKHCGWTGLGSDMTSGESFGDGVDMDCPKCKERYGFVQWSVAVAANAPPGWEARIGRIAD